MKADAPSRTAEWVAAARNLGMLLPDELRIAEDPYGAAFTSSRVPKLLAITPGARRLVMMRGFGTWVTYMQVRTRVLDDHVRQFVARTKGRGQVVILGAGYDCRALRLPELAGVAVFEVDHPSTQRHKREVLDKLGASSPARYVTWDFEHRPMAQLPDALADAGLDRTRPTITIWEGVTMYLTEPAIDASIRAIRAWSGRGSALAMTYVAKARGSKTTLASRLVRMTVRRAGEPFRWAWEPDALGPYLRARGFTIEQDRSLNDVAYELLPPRFAGLVRKAGSRYAIASAGEAS